VAAVVDRAPAGLEVSVVVEGEVTSVVADSAVLGAAVVVILAA
jgi:hypothetical protein